MSLVGMSPRFVHCKTALKDTPEFKEVRKLIGALHAESRQKVDHDREVQCALDQLFGQLQAMREGLTILSEAFVEETGRQNKRIIQLEKQVHVMHERHDFCHRQLEARLDDVVHHLGERIAAADAARCDSHDQLLLELQTLDHAWRSRLQDATAECVQRASELDERHANEVLDVRRAVAGNKVEAQQQHSTALKHAQALSDEVARLAAAHEQIDVLRQGQQAQLNELHGRVDEVKRDQAESTRHMAAQGREHAASVVDTVLAQLEHDLGQQQQDAAAQMAGLKHDLGRVVARLRNGLNDVLAVCGQNRAAAAEALAGLRADVQERIADVVASVASVRDDHGSALASLREEAAAVRAARDADLEILERALTAAHENQEQTDRVLKGALESMREMELKVGTVAQQGDMAAGEIEELTHRLGIIQRALMETTKEGAAYSPAVSLTSSMRRGRRSPRTSPSRGADDFY